MRRAILLAFLLCSFGSSGCIYFERTVRFSEADRVPVRFESSEASELFFNALLVPKPVLSDMRYLVTPVGFGVKWTVNQAEWHNLLVKRMDVDKDGLITVEEAQQVVEVEEE